MVLYPSPVNIFVYLKLRFRTSIKIALRFLNKFYVQERHGGPIQMTPIGWGLI